MEGERKTLAQLSVPICLETLFYMLSGMVDKMCIRDRVLCDCLSSSEEKSESKTVDLIQLFLAAKRVEGCSNKTVHYYESTIRNAVEKIRCV